MQLATWTKSILKRHQDSLSAKLKQHLSRTTPALEIKDPFIVSSCVQKGLRRGDAKVATAAALSLLALDPSRLWRRLVVCAFEDFGLSDLDLTGSVVVAASDKHWRAQVGGDDHVVTYLIEQLVARPRDRRVDNLYMLAVRHVRHPPSRAEFLAQRSSGTLTDLVLRAEKIVVECEQEVPNRSFRAVLASRCDQALQRMADKGTVDVDLHAVCAQGRRTSACLLPVLLPLAKRATEEVGVPNVVVTRDAPEVHLIDGVPSYAVCGFTRVGQEALAQLARSDRGVARAVGALKGRKRMDALTFLLFAVEGGVCTKQLGDPISDELERVSLGGWTGLSREAIPSALAVMRDSLPALNAIRASLMSSRSEARA